MAAQWGLSQKNHKMINDPSKKLQLPQVDKQLLLYEVKCSEIICLEIKHLEIKRREIKREWRSNVLRSYVNVLLDKKIIK